MSQAIQTNADEIVLGKDYSPAKRWIAFLAIAIIYFFYCYNFMIGTFSNNATTYLVTGLGMSAVTAGAIYSLQGTGQLVGYLVWGFLSDRLGRKFPAIGMALSAVAVFVYTRLGGNDTVAFYAVSILIGFMVGYSGPWGAYYTELFPDKFRSLSAGMSFNGGRIISTFAIPAIAGTAGGAMGMMPIFYIAIAVFAAGTLVWFALPETLKRK